MKHDMRATMLGLGLDDSKGHKRVTRGDNFYLIGGSEKTHDVMLDTSLRFNHELKKQCKTLEELDRKEWQEIMRKIAKFQQNQ